MILALETSTKNCSVALIKGQEVRALVEAHSDQYIHSEKLHLFIEQALKQVGIGPKDLGGIAVGSGPGSYTGLRIGVSTAKALAYSLGIPLISAKGPELLLAEVLPLQSWPEGALLHPMIDARRMEVYSLNHDPSKEESSGVEAIIIDDKSYTDGGPHYFFGDGAAKLKDVLQKKEHHFIDLEWPSAAHFRHLLPRKLEQKEFEDVAYFEPFYLKTFQAIKPKNVF